MSYVKDTSKFYFQSTSGQRTIYSTEDEKLEEILNKEGIELYQKVLKKVENEEYKDTLQSLNIIHQNPGIWVPNESSPHYNPKEHQRHYSDLSNLVVMGFAINKGSNITTSTLIFLTNDWCYTFSGSLYKLEKKSSN